MEKKKSFSGPKRAIKSMRGLFSGSKSYAGFEFVCPSSSRGQTDSSDMCWFAAEGALSDLSKVSSLSRGAALPSKATSSSQVSVLCTLPKPKANTKKKKRSFIPGRFTKNVIRLIMPVLCVAK